MKGEKGKQDKGNDKRELLIMDWDGWRGSM